MVGFTAARCMMAGETHVVRLMDATTLSVPGSAGTDWRLHAVPGGALAWDLGDERMDDWVVGMDPAPPDVHETQRGPPCDACVDPPAPDC
ncbi:MAG: hypothetical protein MUF54_18820 [Polyangiaceae bacterium]|nr:hypothetical protein [Polyangiaceae bacterium]